MIFYDFFLPFLILWPKMDPDQLWPPPQGPLLRAQKWKLDQTKKNVPKFMTKDPKKVLHQTWDTFKPEILNQTPKFHFCHFWSKFQKSSILDPLPRAEKWKSGDTKKQTS